MRKNKKKNTKMILLIVLLLIGIGFAALAANLKIDGTVNIDSASWDVHFENVQVTQGSVTANPAPTSDDTTTTEMTYTINFTKPGDFYEFTVDIANDGSLDAMIDLVSNTSYESDGTTPKNLPDYLRSTVTYADGAEIKQKQKLDHNTIETIKVRVEYRTDIDPSDLPDTADTIVFKFSGNFKQKDATAIEKFGGTIDKSKQYTSKNVEQKGLIGVAYLNPTNPKNRCTESNSTIVNGNMNESGCKKFYIFAEDSTSYTMILAHALSSTYSAWNTSGDNTDGMAEIQTQLETETSGWIGNPRLITADEVAEIVEADAELNWSSTTATSSDSFCFDDLQSGSCQYDENSAGTSEYAWLFDYTMNCSPFGCDNSFNYDGRDGIRSHGYWTSTPVSGDTTSAWRVCNGSLTSKSVDNGYENNGYGMGVRPVITISK